MATFSFEKCNRLLSSKDFKQTFDAARKVYGGNFICFWKPNGLECCRLGLVVSKKVGNAVIRNRVKRNVREAFRHLKPDYLTELPTAVDLVVIARASGAEDTFNAVLNNLQKVAGKVSKRLRQDME